MGSFEYTYDVFISHSSKDKEKANKIYKALEDANIHCFYSPEKIHGGEKWNEEIVAALEQSKVFLLIYSENARTSTYIPKELIIAGEKHLRLIPFKLDDTEFEDTFKLQLANVQWISGTHGEFTDRVKELVDLIVSILPKIEDKKDTDIIINGKIKKIEEEKRRLDDEKRKLELENETIKKKIKKNANIHNCHMYSIGL